MVRCMQVGLHCLGVHGMHGPVSWQGSTCMTLIFEADSPVLILTVRGMGIPSAMPATSLPSFVGLRNRAAPNPLLVASACTT